MKAVRIVVGGRVQGVFYRVRARDEAQRLGVTGSCTNADDGTVRVVAEGEDAAVDAFTAWCRTGPSSADVRSVAVDEIAPAGRTGFVIR